jgi:hypothetical protein
MTSETFYVRVRGGWDSSPEIYIGPFESSDAAREAVNRSGASLDKPAPDPKRDIVVSILTDAEAHEAGRRDRHTLPPRSMDGEDTGFDVPANLDEYNVVYYRLFGFH